MSASAVTLVEGARLEGDVCVATQPHAQTVGAVLLGIAEPARRESLTDAAQLLARMIAAQLL